MNYTFIGIKTVLAKGLNTFPIKCTPIFSNCPKLLPKNYPDFSIFCNSVFESFILADKPFAKAFRILETCVWLIIICTEN